MKIFLDANILVALLTREELLYKPVTRIFSLSPKRFQFHTSTVGLAIAFYYASKKYSRQKAKIDIAVLVTHLTVTDCGILETSASLSNKSVEDFEDGLEYYSAINAGCDCIITEDLNDFYFSKIEVLNSTAFLNKYVLFKK